MAVELYLVDSNVMIRWVQREAPEYSIVDESIAVLARSGSIPCYTSQNLGELWNVLTRPADRNGYGLSPIEADRKAKEIESSLRLLPDSSLIHEKWRQLLVDYRVSGVQVHDARLVAAMRVHDVRQILTFNARDFARYPGIEAIHPRQLAGR